MAYSAGQAAYKLAFEIAPITLTGGAASGIIGGMLPVLSLVQSLSFSGLLGGGGFSLDNAFANFHPLPGASLIEAQIGTYPFANLNVAANCIIQQPLQVSMLMRCPVRSEGEYFTKMMIMNALQSTLKQHMQQGGLFNVATPSFYYTNCILQGLHDVTGGESAQAQTDWKWDFIQPLVTQQQAAAAQNAMMSQLSSGAPTTGALSGNAINLGNPSTVTTPGVSPAAVATSSTSVPATPQ